MSGSSVLKDKSFAFAIQVVNLLVPFFAIVVLSYDYWGDDFFSMEGVFFCGFIILLMVNIITQIYKKLWNIFWIQLVKNIATVIICCFCAYVLLIDLFGVSFSGAAIPSIWIWATIINMVLLFRAITETIFIRIKKTMQQFE
jgi:FlaA1/EpsC-like NDP-sugar epimerase